MECDWPIYWEAQFATPGPFALEIGFGNGRFLIAQAERLPDHNFIGIDTSWPSVERLLKQLEQTERNNVRVLHGNAAVALDRLFSSNTLAKIWINFPDPWPKQRHHTRRLIRPQFVDLLTDRLERNGELIIATDHPDYARHIARVLAQNPLLQSQFLTPSISHSPQQPRTKYEHKAQREGRHIHDFIYRKHSESPVQQVQNQNVEPLPPIRLNAPGVAPLPNGFTPRSWQATHKSTPVIGKILNIYTSLKNRHLLIEMLIKEGDLTQRIGIVIQSTATAQTLIELSPIGHPRTTWGVKQAIRRIAQTLLDDHPNWRVIATPVKLKPHRIKVPPD